MRTSIWFVATAKVGFWPARHLGRKWLFDFNAWKPNLFCLTSLITLVLKSSFKIPELSFSSKLNLGSHIISIAKTASKKIRALICSMKFLFPYVYMYLFKSTYDLAWSIFVISELVHRTVGPSLVASLEPLVHHLNAASLSLFCRYYFGRYSSELAELVPLTYSHGRSTFYSDRLHISVVIPWCYKNSMILESFFPHTARLWNYLSITCFSWHLLSASSF